MNGQSRLTDAFAAHNEFSRAHPALEDFFVAIIIRAARS